MSDSRPIGVFDSGVGGLTVARAVLDRLPNESLLYVGDSAHFPYGPKPVEEIRGYALDIAAYLVDRDVKLLVVACNSIEVSAIGDIATAHEVPVIGVINPGARAATRATRSGVVGVIGTVATIETGAYQRAIGSAVELHAAACPAFVEHVERGDTTSDELRMAARGYLAPLREEGHRHVDPRLHALPAAVRAAPLGAGARRRAGVLRGGDREGRGSRAPAERPAPRGPRAARARVPGRPATRSASATSPSCSWDAASATSSRCTSRSGARR